MDTQDFWDLCRAFFAVATVLTSLTGLWRLRNWHVRTSRYEPPGAVAVSEKSDTKRNKNHNTSAGLSLDH